MAKMSAKLDSVIEFFLFVILLMHVYKIGSNKLPVIRCKVLYSLVNSIGL